MDIRTFRAPSLQAALQRVREELGPDASVLQTRQVGAGLMGILGRRQIEVQASLDIPVTRRLYGDRDRQPRIENSSPPSPPLLGASESADSVPSPCPIDPIFSASQIANKTWPNDANNKPSNPKSQSNPSADVKQKDVVLSPAMFDVYSELLDFEFDPELARDLIRQVSDQIGPDQQHDSWLVKGRLCQLIQRHIRIADPIEVHRSERQIVALVGPTGVGKTTTLAKLAAEFQLDGQFKVGFLTIDAHRPGAIEGLRCFAQTLGSPLEIAKSPDKIPEALDRMIDCHLVLMDTAGHTPNNSDKMAILEDFLRASQPTSTHLVVSATSSSSFAQTLLEGFEVIKPTGVILTKLDEANCMGSWFRVLANSNMPISYLANGQQIPQDIVVATRRRVASLLVGQSQ